MASYFQVLAKLAGDEEYDFKENIDGLAKSIKDIPESKLDKIHVDAYAKLVEKTTEWITYAARQKNVRKMIQESNEPL